MRTSTDIGPCSLRARFGRSRQLISQPDRSDRSDRPVRPVEPTIELAAEPVLVPSVDKAPAVPLTTEEEELVDYEVSPECTNLEINVVHLSSDYFVVPEEDLAHL